MVRSLTSLTSFRPSFQASMASSLAGSEDSPLLSSENNAGHDQLDDVYLRFSSTRKKIILTMVSGCIVIHYSMTETFTPSIPQIAKDLNSTGAVVNTAVSMSILASSLGALTAASYSTFYGRRPIYLFNSLMFVIGSAGLAAAQSIPSLLFWRFIQAMGGSLGPVLGSAVIGDIFKLEERGGAMGVCFAIGLFGSILTPLPAGWITHSYSWRVVHVVLGFLGLIIFTTIYFFFPETIQPGATGIEKMKAAKGIDSSNTPFIFKFINPFKSLWLLRSPSLLLTGIIMSASQLSFFVSSVPLPYTLGVRYHITNEALIGACYLPAGIGSMVGVTIVGRVSDHIVIKWRRKRKGVWYPEDRLRAAIVPLAAIIPLSLSAFGFVNKFVDGNLGLGLSLVCLFVNGGGVDMAFAICTVYLVDIMQSRSSEILAAINIMRSVLGASTVAIILPMIDAYGAATTYLLITVLIWTSYGILCYIIKYGDEMRVGIDVEFSAAEDNSKLPDCT